MRWRSVFAEPAVLGHERGSCGLDHQGIRTAERGGGFRKPDVAGNVASHTEPQGRNRPSWRWVKAVLPTCWSSAGSWFRPVGRRLWATACRLATALPIPLRSRQPHDCDGAGVIGQGGVTTSAASGAGLPATSTHGRAEAATRVAGSLLAVRRP